MRQTLVKLEPGLVMVPSGTVSLTKVALAVHWLPPPEAGAVGGALVAPGVTAAGLSTRVGSCGSSVGVGAEAWVAACSVSCAWTVIATRVAMTDSLGAAPHALRRMATMERKAIELNLCCTVIWVPFDGGDYKPD